MTRNEKVNYIKMWLQKFGDRDNETFNTEVFVGETLWELSLQYSFDEEGKELQPFDWCRHGFKHVFDNSISDRTDDELDSIISNLKIKQSYY
jgi:hypothetical protein